MRFLARSPARAYRPDMEVVRIIDGDERSLSSRLARVLAALGPECTVLRFTYWYTGRPPPPGCRRASGGGPGGAASRTGPPAPRRSTRRSSGADASEEVVDRVGR